MRPGATASGLLRALGYPAGKEREFLDHFASMVLDHDHYRSLLMTCEPAKREQMYRDLRYRLRFTPKPLDVYIVEAGAIAERERLPEWNPDTQRFTPFSPYEIGAAEQSKLTQVAQQSVSQAFELEKGKIRLRLVCARCTHAADFYGSKRETRVDVVLKARRAGWVYVPPKYDREPTELCPTCAKERVN